MTEQRKRGISWTDETWNPIVGCSKVSSGCQNCWAERMAKLHYHSEFPNGWDGHVKLFPDRLEMPLHWKRPRKIAVGLMGDLFHEDVPDDFIDKVFAVMALCQQHTFQVLTKRPERMQRWFNDIGGVTRDDFFFHAAHKIINAQRLPSPMPYFPFPNVWIGVSVENQATADERIPPLLQTHAAVRFVSAEPLLGKIDLTNIPTGKGTGDEWDPVITMNVLKRSSVFAPHINWLIVGGESGPGVRPMHPDWVRSLRDQCVAAGVAFHFKQWGEWTHCSNLRIDTIWPKSVWMHPDGRMFDAGDVSGGGWECMVRVGKKAGGHLLDGKEWLNFPK